MTSGRIEPPTRGSQRVSSHDHFHRIKNVISNLGLGFYGGTHTFIRGKGEAHTERVAYRHISQHDRIVNNNTPDITTKISILIHADWIHDFITNFPTHRLKIMTFLGQFHSFYNIIRCSQHLKTNGVTGIPDWQRGRFQQDHINVIRLFQHVTNIITTINQQSQYK